MNREKSAAFLHTLRRLYGDMRRVRKQLPDKLAKAAEAQLLAQPHNRRGGDKCRQRQLAH